MGEQESSASHRVERTEKLKAHVRDLGVDVVGVADLKSLQDIPTALPAGSLDLLARYQYAIVLGAQLGKLGPKAPGIEVDMFLERAALEALDLLEGTGIHALIVHTEDELDPVRRLGLVSLKALAKGAGLGWQGRSLLIVSPEYGPLHRLIAVLTDAPLHADEPVPNRCDECSRCVDKCPQKALTLVPFDDHPARREDVLDIAACKGDDGCKACLLVCPWTRVPLEQ